MALIRKRREHSATEVDRVYENDQKSEEHGLAVRDDEIGTFRAFHLARTPERKEGPYYIAPDSAEPLPDAIWKNLDPAVVEAEVDSLNQLNGGKGLEIGGEVDRSSIQLLEEDDDLGRQVIKLLQSGSAESANDLLDDE